MFTVSWILQNFLWITNPANFCDNRMEFGQFIGREHTVYVRAPSMKQLSMKEAIIVRIKKKDENIHFLRCVVRLIEVIEVTQPNLEHSSIKYFQN